MATKTLIEATEIILKNTGIILEHRDDKFVYFKLIKDLEYINTKISLTKQIVKNQDGLSYYHMAESCLVYNTDFEESISINTLFPIKFQPYENYVMEYGGNDHLYNSRVSYLYDLEMNHIQAIRGHHHLPLDTHSFMHVRNYDLNNLLSINKPGYVLSSDNINFLVKN